ncbi:MAG TPA: ribosome maturation factor RimP [Acidimicrobiales bacterium]|jgi:ribosome maturation factor RimP|nr:ribosome maturation factor RimP [Acidimicrobiales bacterium]
MDPTGRVRELVEPLLNTLGTEVFDVELKAGILRISIDRANGEPVDLDAITEASRVVSEALDEADPVPGQYSLEVSSPGLERPLRTPDHYRRFVGTTISVKTNPDVEGERRIQGLLDQADDAGITVAGRHLAYGDIERARTVFEWGGQPQKKLNTKKTEKKKAAS